jgi:hypothetical protein
MKVGDYAESLSNWPLRDQGFPNIDRWLSTEWTAPYGRDAALDFLASVAAVRSANYWNASDTQRRGAQRDRAYHAQRLRGVFKDLAGDEFTGAWAANNPGAIPGSQLLSLLRKAQDGGLRISTVVPGRWLTVPRPRTPGLRQSAAGDLHWSPGHTLSIDRRVTRKDLKEHEEIRILLMEGSLAGMQLTWLWLVIKPAEGSFSVVEDVGIYPESYSRDKGEVTLDNAHRLVGEAIALRAKENPGNCFNWRRVSIDHFQGVDGHGNTWDVTFKGPRYGKLLLRLHKNRDFYTDAEIGLEGFSYEDMTSWAEEAIAKENPRSKRKQRRRARSMGVLDEVRLGFPTEEDLLEEEARMREIEYQEATGWGAEEEAEARYLRDIEGREEPGYTWGGIEYAEWAEGSAPTLADLTPAAQERLARIKKWSEDPELDYPSYAYGDALRGALHTTANLIQQLSRQYGPRAGRHLGLIMGSAMVDVDYIDNWRWADKGSPWEVVNYKEAYDSGCCGSWDEEVEFEGKTYLLGFNYGH